MPGHAMGGCRGCGGRSSLLLFGAIALCLLRGLDAESTCPVFGAGDTIVETAPGCQHEVEIPFTMRSDLYAQTEIAILDVSPAAACCC